TTGEAIVERTGSTDGAAAATTAAASTVRVGATRTSMPHAVRCTFDEMVDHVSGADEAVTSASPGERGTSSHADRQPLVGSNSAIRHGSSGGHAAATPTDVVVELSPTTATRLTASSPQ